VLPQVEEQNLQASDVRERGLYPLRGIVSEAPATWRRKEDDGVVCEYVNIGAVEQNLCVARPFSVSNIASDLGHFIAYRNLPASQ
jgi:hypothetical protein